MSGWTYDDGEHPSCSYSTHPQPYYSEQNQKQPVQGPSSAPAQPITFPENPNPFLVPSAHAVHLPIRGNNPRESRNKAEKQRRDKMSQSIARLVSILPPVASSGRKVDKTTVLRLTAHYIRAHKHVFGDTLYRGPRVPRFGMNFTSTFLNCMKGFLVTVTYKGLIVVVSPNIQEYLGYTEVELLGQSFYNMIHPDDHLLLRKQLMPTSCRLTTNGELFLSKEPDAAVKAAEELKKEKRNFIVRFKKQTHLRSEPPQYITCHMEGSFRKSDGAGVFVDRVVQTGRRVRSRGNNPYASGNDIVFVGMVRPITDSFLNESKIEGFKMEYRTRHSIDGEIIQCEQRISLITGYMTHEVNGTNAMNFMHRDDVRWVIVALREMYDQRRLSGESCYRLMTKNGEFIHMRTRGNLDVDPKTQEATSFVCVNTMVSEEEGTKLIQEMKNKFAAIVKNEKPQPDIESKLTQIIETPAIPVEDPRQLEKVICHLVTDLPSAEPAKTEDKDSKQKVSIPRLSIIPPKREQIAKAIEKSYSVIKTLRRSEINMENLMDLNYPSPFATPPSSPELPRAEVVQNQQIHNQQEEIPQFIIDNQEFWSNVAADYNAAMPQPMQLDAPSQQAIEVQPIQHLRPMQTEPNFPTVYPGPVTFQPFELAQPFIPFGMMLQPLQPIQPMQLQDTPPMPPPAVDPVLVYLPEHMEEVQPVPILQQAQQVPQLQETQPVVPIQEAQPMLTEQNSVAPEDGEDLIQLLERDTNDEASFEITPEFFDMLNMDFPEDKNLFERAFEASRNLLDTSVAIINLIEQEYLNQSAEQNKSTEQSDLIKEVLSIMEESNIVEINPHQEVLDEVYLIVDNECQIIFIDEENVAATDNRNENNQVETGPAEIGANQNSQIEIAAQESTSYDPYRFVDDAEPI